MPIDIMLDLETWGTRPGSAIRSIGAIAFDPATGAQHGTFYRNVDDISCKALGLGEDESTKAFWRGQRSTNPDAEAAFASPAPVPLPRVLEEFAAFYGRYTADVDITQPIERQHDRFPRLWCHGANFDEPLLGAAYYAAHAPLPWPYTAVRCTRTVYALAGVRVDKSTGGTVHHALNDCVRQIDALVKALGILGAPKAVVP